MPDDLVDMAGLGDARTRTTGLPLDPYFPSPKMAWLRRNITSEGVVTTSDAWLVHRLTGAYVTDATTASRTLLLDLGDAHWSEEASAAFGLNPMELPTVVGGAQEIGRTDAFGPSMLLSGLGVDQQAALVGEHCLEAGESKCTLARAPSSWPMPGLDRSPPRADWPYRWRGSSESTGPLHRWSGLCRGSRPRLAATLGILRARQDLDDAGRFGARQRRGLQVVPALSGLGAPPGGVPMPWPASRGSAPAQRPPMSYGPPSTVWRRR